jgi:hypothetical protein
MLDSRVAQSLDFLHAMNKSTPIISIHVILYLSLCAIF